MNRIEQMIHDLCVNGVKRVKLGELGSFYSGLSGKSKKDFEDGNAKFITYKNVYNNPALKIDVEDTVKIAPNEKQNTIQYGDILFTGSSETPDECAFSSVLNIHTEEKLYLNSFCFGFRFNDLSQVNIDFYKHYFRCLDMRKRIAKTANGTTRFNVSKKDFAQLEIPLPPLEIQGEIVKILDRFAVLTAELEAELEARRKQYEYYRTLLLDFSEGKKQAYEGQRDPRTRLLSFDSDSRSDTVQWKALGEVCVSLKTGLNPRQNFKLNEPGATNYYITVRELTGTTILPTDKTDLVTDEAIMKINNRSNLEKNDILFSGTGTIGRTALIESTPTNWNIKEGVYTIKPKIKIIIPKFLLYYFNCQLFKDSIADKIVGSPVRSIPMKDLKEILIPIPPLAEQERIVNILDKFDQLVNGVKDSIPELIDSVQKQYEYYRNKLLTFHEA